MARYDVVLLDADNTLFDFTRAEHDALMDALHFRGIDPNEDMVQVYSTVNENMWKMLERGEIGKSELRVARFAVFCEKYGIKTDPLALANAYTECLSEKSYLIAGAENLCRRLTKAGVRLYIITNGLKSVQDRRLAASPLPAYFDGIFISEEVGFEKPSAAFFDAVRCKIDRFDPARTLVVGDSLTSDIQGGINAGLDTCWYNPKGKAVSSDTVPTYVIAKLEELLQVILT